MAGLIVLLVGIAGLVLGLFLAFSRREPGPPPEPRYERDPRYSDSPAASRACPGSS
jgi:hypothetical protein